MVARKTRLGTPIWTNDTLLCKKQGHAWVVCCRNRKHKVKLLYACRRCGRLGLKRPGE